MQIAPLTTGCRIMNNHIPILLLAIMLSACNAETVSDTEFPVESVMRAQYQEPSDVILYKSVENGDVFTTQTINSPLPDTTFNGVPVKSTKSTNVSKKNGEASSYMDYISYYQASPLAYIGAKYSDEYELASNQIPLPQTAKIGDSGKVYTSQSWSDESKKTLIGEAVATWTLKTANDNTA